MARRRWLSLFGVLAIFSAGAAASVGCADEDPRYGPAESFYGAGKGKKIDYGGGVAPDEPAEGGAVLTGAAGAFKTLYDSIDKTCNPCHTLGTNNAAKFMGADSEATRTLFKNSGYNVANSGFVTKGQHSGPPLTTEQKGLVDAWIAAEGGGAAPPADAGGGG